MRTPGAGSGGVRGARAWGATALLLLVLGAAPGRGEPRDLADRLLRGRPGLLMAMDPRSGKLLLRADRRRYRGRMPVGSLIKPFTLLAWAETHDLGAAPELRCPPGGPPVCWYPPGHGRRDLVGALEVSCNHYFARLAEEVDPARARAWRQRLGLGERGQGEGTRRLVGLGDDLRLEPQAVLEAYAALLGGGRRYRASPRTPLFLGELSPPRGVLDQLRRGLGGAARRGTGQAAARAFAAADLLAKTGTTVRLDPSGRAQARGTSAWFVGLAPAAAPRLAVLVHLEEGTGSRDAAPLGGELMAALWEGDRRGEPGPAGGRVR